MDLHVQIMFQAHVVTMFRSTLHAFFQDMSMD
jgi:hypothetical protein